MRLIFWALLISSSCFGLSDMTLDEKVGQLLMAHFQGEIANEDAKRLIQDTKVGSIIYYKWANGLYSFDQVALLSKSLQRLSYDTRLAIPLLIAVDQEGGAVSRLTSGFTHFPANRTIAETGSLDWAKEIAFQMGKEMRAAGVNMNFAPVVDVNSNANNPVIGPRSFSDDPKAVVAFGAKMLDGFKKAHVISTLKHFPGHGDVTVDSHQDLPVVDKSMQELEKIELFPFARLAASADAIMTAHILVPAFDEENCATCSKNTLSYLREKIGFQGVIISDSLAMGGVLKKCSTIDEAAICALNAGCDLLVLGGKILGDDGGARELTVKDVQRVHRSIVQAVQQGRICEKMLDEKVQRVLQLKEEYTGYAMVSIL